MGALVTYYDDQVVVNDPTMIYLIDALQSVDTTPGRGLLGPIRDNPS